MDFDKKASEPVRLEVEVLNDSMDEESSVTSELLCRTDDTDGGTDRTDEFISTEGSGPPR